GRTNCRRVRQILSGRDRGRVAGGGRTDGRADGRPVRAIPGRTRTCPTWAIARSSSPWRAYSESSKETDGRRAKGSRMSVRRTARALGTLMLVGGVAVLIWVVVVWQWQDPFTAAYTTWKQHQLSQSYEKRYRDYEPPEQVE